MSLKSRQLLFFLIIVVSASAMDVQIVGSSDSHLLVEVRFDSIAVHRYLQEGVWYSRVTLPNAGALMEPGKPDLPMAGIMLGIPANSKPKLTVLNESGEIREIGTVAVAEGKISEPMTGWYPAKAAEIGADGLIRRQRTLQVSLFPVRYAADKGVAHISRSMTLRIDFNSSAVTSPAVVEAEFEPVYRNLLANYEQSRSWRAASTPSLSKSSAVPSFVRLYVQQEGVYSVTGRELAEAGVDLLSVDPQSVALYCKGKPVPVLVEGQADGRFDYQDRIIFIGEHNRGDNSYYSSFSDNNVYQLTWGTGPSLRFSPLAVPPTGDWSSAAEVARMTLHFEKDLRYERMIGYPHADDDHWMWAQLTDDDEFHMAVDLPGYVDGSINLRAVFHGITKSKNSQINHHVQALINDQPVGEAWGASDTPFALEASAFTLSKPAPMRLKLRLPRDLPGVQQDAVFLNWFEFDYDRRLTAENGELVFDLTDRLPSDLCISGFDRDGVFILTQNGARLSGYGVRRSSDGAEFLLSAASLTPTRVYAVSEKGLRRVSRVEIDQPSALRSAGGADYLIVTHREFLTSAHRLADYRESAGLRTQVVDVQDVYDEFGGGVYDPRAIRQFVKFAFENWRPAPTYLLLLGDATYFMDKAGNGKSTFRSFVPSYMVNTTSFGMTSSDNYFAAVSGDDDLPDLFVGRLPANSTEQAEVMIDKIIAYETRQTADVWRRNVSLIAGSGDFFSTAADYVDAHHLPRWLAVNKLYTDPNSPKFRTTEDLIDWINQGQSILNFLVHGAGEQIDDNDLLGKDDMLRLKNADRYSFAVTMSCYIGHFDNPEKHSLGEALLTEPNRGIMALFGSAGKSYRYADFYFNNAVFDGIFRQKRRTLGEITTFAKYDLISQTRGFYEPVRNFLLLGDPATRLILPEASLPLTLSKTVLVEGDKLRVSGEVSGRGTLTLTAVNDADSVIAEKQLEASGKFEIDLVTMTPQLRRAWGESGGSGHVRAFFNNGAAAAVGAQQFSVVRPLIRRFTHQPLYPVSYEPVTFVAEIDANAGTGAVQALTVQWAVGLNWNETPMIRDGNLWKTTAPLSFEEGTVVNYRLRIRSADGFIETDVTRYAVQYKPDLFTDAPLRLTGNGDLLVTVKNRGESDARNVPVRVMNLTGNRPLVESVIVPLIRSRADTSVTAPLAPLPAGSYDLEVIIDPDNVIPEEDKINNRALRTLHVITPGEGSNGVLRFFDNDVTVYLPEKSVLHSVSLELKPYTSAELSQAAQASALTSLKTATAAPQFFQLQLADSTVTTAPVKVTIGFDPEDSLTAEQAADGLRIYAWLPEFKLWKGLPTTRVVMGSRVSATLPAGVATFALMASSDREAPQVRIGVEGQHFADGDVVPSRPTFLISLEDAGGVDVTPEALIVTLDGAQVAPADFTLSFDPQNPRLARLSFSPTVSRDHELRVSVADLHGNSTARTVRFRVAQEFGVEFVANHPNPFLTETTVAFIVNDLASKVKLDIYTVSGRHVRAFEFADITGYHEVDWFGEDERGEPVANGVYYLKFVAVQDSKRIEKIVKMAKLQ